MLSKLIIFLSCYDLGTISSGTLNQDLALLWSKLSGKSDQEKLVIDNNDLKKVTKSKKFGQIEQN